MKCTIKNEFSQLYQSITKKMDNVKSNSSTAVDYNKIQNQVERATNPIKNEIQEIKKSIKIMQITLAEELQKVKNPIKLPKQDFPVWISCEVPKNILSFGYYKKFSQPPQFGGPQITPLTENFNLQKRNGTFHCVIGETFLIMRSKRGYEKVPFYVIDNLYGSAYITTETAQFLQN